MKSFSAFLTLGYSITTGFVCQALFLFFCTFFSEDTFLRCRSLKCLHILSQQKAFVNTFFELFRHFLQRTRVVLVHMQHIACFALPYTIYSYYSIIYLSVKLPIASISSSFILPQVISVSGTITKSLSFMRG